MHALCDCLYHDLSRAVAHSCIALRQQRTDCFGSCDAEEGGESYIDPRTGKPTDAKPVEAAWLSLWSEAHETEYFFNEITKVGPCLCCGLLRRTRCSPLQVADTTNRCQHVLHMSKLPCPACSAQREVGAETAGVSPPAGGDVGRAALVRVAQGVR